MANDPVPGHEARQPTINPQAISNAQAAAQNSPQSNVVATSATVQKSVEVITPVSAPATNPLANVVKPTFFDEEKTDANPQKTEPVSQEDASSNDADEEANLANPGAENFKKLRKSHGELKKSLAEIAREKEELRSKLTQYETGEAVPEVLKAKDEEITRLSRYEKLVNLKGSKEYKEKYVTPIEQTKQKLKEIFADYGVPAEALDSVVNKAINTSKRPELNQMLLEHLGNDELGASEAKAHVFKAWEIQKQAREAEAEPAKALETLQQETESIQQVREVERRNRIVKVAENTWVETLEEIRQEGTLLELIHKEDDPEFNQTYPDKLLPQAAKEYGKMITELGKQGLTDLPKLLAKAVAKMVLLAHASGVSAETRNWALGQVDTLTENLTRRHTQLRPPIGGGVPRNAAGKPVPTTLTPEQEAANIINQVRNKR